MINRGWIEAAVLVPHFPPRLFVCEANNQDIYYSLDFPSSRDSIPISWSLDLMADISSLDVPIVPSESIHAELITLCLLCPSPLITCEGGGSLTITRAMSLIEKNLSASCKNSSATLFTCPTMGEEISWISYEKRRNERENWEEIK